MKRRLLLLSVMVCAAAMSVMQAAVTKTTVATVTSDIELDSKGELHITASENCIAPGVFINITSEDAWVIFDNVKPSAVISTYLKQIKINGVALASNQAQQKAWVNVYRRGAAVIPHASSVKPLTVYTGDDFTGSSTTFGLVKNASLGTGYNNKIKGFKLKRGYMAVLGQASDGSGYSRCFIAQDDDIEIGDLADPKQCTNGGALKNKISYIRVSRWQMPSKKGLVDRDVTRYGGTWHYNYDASNLNDNNREYVNMWHHIQWNTAAKNGPSSNTSGVNHTLFFNEPWNLSDGGESEKLFVNGVASVPAGIPYYQQLVKSGARIGSMASTDGNVAKTREFVRLCDQLGLRIDFVVLHVYQYHDAQWWYNYTRDIYNATGRPVWITEWNNGANWTNESWPSTLQDQWIRSRDITKAVIQKFDEAPWVERYSIYGAVENKRDIENRTGSAQTITIDGQTRTFGKDQPTPSGEAYRDFDAGMAYNPAVEFVPIYPVFTAPTTTFNTNFLITSGQVRITAKDTNGEYYDSIRIDSRIGNGAWKYEDSMPNTPSYGVIINWDNTVTAPVTYKVSYFYCNEATPRFSDEATVDLSIATVAPVQFGKVTIARNDAANVIYTKFDSKATIPVLGAASQGNLYEANNYFVPSIFNLDSATMQIRAIPWGYLYNYNKITLEGLTFSNSSEIPYLLIDSTQTVIDKMPVDAGIVRGVKGDWVSVQFKHPFAEAPVVFPTVMSSANYTANSAPVQPRIRNVTATGFELRLTREANLTKAWSAENVAYAAIPMGTHEIYYISKDGKPMHLHITAGVTEANLATTERQQTFDVEFPQVPSYIVGLQTSEDDRTSVLSHRLPTKTSIRYRKVAEQSKDNSPTSGKDQAGYIAIYTDEPGVGLTKVETGVAGITLYQDDNLLKVIATQANFTIYSADGTALLNAPTNEPIDVSYLPVGTYIIRVNGGGSVKYIKK